MTATAFLLLLLSTIAAAQTVHQVRVAAVQVRELLFHLLMGRSQVNVGDNGLFFNPQSITAVEGDIVTFNFIGRCVFKFKLHRNS